MSGYIYGVHCGNQDCYACATQRYNCNELDNLDAIENGDNDCDVEARTIGTEDC